MEERCQRWRKTLRFSALHLLPIRLAQNGWVIDTGITIGARGVSWLCQTPKWLLDDMD